VDSKEIKRRSTVLQAVDADLQEKFRQSCRGLNETVLIEKTNPFQGRCTRYFMVNLSKHPNAKQFQKGQIAEVSL
jgi:tRNA A37 methylthiotransferase MiaB